MNHEHRTGIAIVATVIAFVGGVIGMFAVIAASVPTTPIGCLVAIALLVSAMFIAGASHGA